MKKRVENQLKKQKEFMEETPRKRVLPRKIKKQ